MDLRTEFFKSDAGMAAIIEIGTELQDKSNQIITELKQQFQDPDQILFPSAEDARSSSYKYVRLCFFVVRLVPTRIQTGR